MNIIKTWAMAIASACVIGTIISFIKPDFSGSKVLGFMLSTFFIAVILNPLGYAKKINADLDIKSEATSFSYENSGEYLKQMQLSAAARSVKDKIEQALRKKNFDFGEVQISMNSDKSGGIFISEVVISGADSHRKQEIHDYIKEEFNLECSVKENA